MSGSQLDSSAGISVSRLEARGANSNSGKSSGQKKHWRGKSDNASKASVELQSRDTSTENTTTTPRPGVAKLDIVSANNYNNVLGQGIR